MPSLMLPLFRWANTWQVLISTRVHQHILSNLSSRYTIGISRKSAQNNWKPWRKVRFFTDDHVFNSLQCESTSTLSHEKQFYFNFSTLLTEFDVRIWMEFCYSICVWFFCFFSIFFCFFLGFRRFTWFFLCFCFSLLFPVFFLLFSVFLLFLALPCFFYFSLLFPEKHPQLSESSSLIKHN